MIVWHPKKQDVNQVCRYKLAVVIDKVYERVLIGDENSIKLRLAGEQAAEVVCDITRPFGTSLLYMDYDQQEKWQKAISYLAQAQHIMTSPMIRQTVMGTPQTYEKEAQKLLQEKYDTEDLLCRFVAMRIWYCYWRIRGLQKSEESNAFLAWAKNMVRPFCAQINLEASRDRLTRENGIFRKTVETGEADGTSVTCMVSDGSTKYILIDDSLVPLERFYGERVEIWKKYLVECKVCGKLFMADSLKYTLCSGACKAKSQNETKSRRKNNPETAEIDKILAGANAHWNNRLTKIRKSPEWSEDRALQYRSAMDHFQMEKSKKRQAHKRGEITFNELRDWLLQQEVRAEETLQSLIE